MSDLSSKLKLESDKLRLAIDPKKLKFKNTDELKPLESIIGQNKAIKAIKMGIGLRSKGYNIFVCGLTGTGKDTTVKKILKDIEDIKPDLKDRCYVNNFKNPAQPILITLPKGKGKEFQKDMSDVVNYLKKNVPKIFEGKGFAKKKEKIKEIYEQKEKELVSDFEKELRENGFTIVQVQSGIMSKPDIFPMEDGEPVPMDKLYEKVKEGEMTEDEYQKKVNKLKKYKQRLSEIMKKTRKYVKNMSGEIEKITQEAVKMLLDDIIGDIKDKYDDKKINIYLDDVEKDILDNISLFKEQKEKQDPIALLQGAQKMPIDPYLQYRVNVILDNSTKDEAPVVIETSPTFNNLFGTIEKTVSSQGQWSTDFSKIKGGSVLEADGGYLVVNALDALTEPGVWKMMKRTLVNNKLEIQGIDSFFGLVVSHIKPEPIDIDVKVILIGDSYIYHLLYQFEDEFKKIFKIKADFDSEMDFTDESIRQYSSFIKMITDKEKLMPFDSEAVAEVIEFGLRKSGKKSKLYTRFSDIADLLRESDYWAKENGNKVVQRKDVEKAIFESIERNNLIESKIGEMIEDGTIMIDTEGGRIGQVNGLSIYNLGNYMFGKPTRITASTSVGKKGIINIEREVNLSGSTHDKGVMILTGYLRENFAQDKPLNLDASICFEQSYSGVDGDSASSTEIYALLSSLSGVELKQSIAVTGSVNQKGDIQPIGGVNQKIEGFFKTCKKKGLNGEQGVLIPKKNVKDLMLDKEIVQAVNDGKFNVWAISRVEEGIEILTGMKAGKKDKNGKYPENTLFYLVDKKLTELVEKSKEFKE